MNNKFIFIKVLTFIILTAAFTGCKSGPDETHEHTFSTEWTSDETYHWHAATCEHTDEVSDKAEHTFGDWETTKKPTEQKAGSKERSCSVCGYKETSEIAKLDHTHNYTWKSDTTNHWQYCEDCEATTEKEAHTFGEWITTKPSTEYATGTQECECSVCKYKKTKSLAKLEHTTHTPEDKWSFDEDKTHHWKKCIGCSEKLSYGEHNFGDWIVDEQETIVKGGSKHRICNDCNFREDAIIPRTLCETPLTNLENETPANENSPFVYFGDFPQSLVIENDGKLTGKDNTTVITINETENNSITIGEFIYYIGSDGEYYTKRTFSTSETDLVSKGIAKWSSVTKWFRLEPILWKVIANDYIYADSNEGKLLLSDKILTAGINYYSSRNNRTIGETTIFPNNYEYSQVRAYLNGYTYYKDDGSINYQYCSESNEKKGFLQSAFSATAQEKIKDTTVDNSQNSTITGFYIKSPTCENTVDKIFLLSIKEVTTYGIAKVAKSNGTTTVVKSKVDFAYSTTDYLNSDWLLRTPNNTGTDIYYPYNNEPSTEYLIDASIAMGVNFTSTYAIVPALVIDLPAAE